jgi:hypothetical protein
MMPPGLAWRWMGYKREKNHEVHMLLPVATFPIFRFDFFFPNAGMGNYISKQEEVTRVHVVSGNRINVKRQRG